MEEPIIFEFYRGDDYSLRLEIKDADQNPIDITGWSFKATMKLSTEMPDSEAGLKVDTGAVEGIAATNGVFYLLLPRDQTANLYPTNYWFDLQRTTAGMVSTVFSGRVKVRPDVTQRT